MSKALLKAEKYLHKSVLLQKLLEYLHPMEDGVYIDATLGLGGHCESILQACNYNTRVIGFDVDQTSVSLASERLNKYKDRVSIYNKNFTHIDEVLSELDIQQVDGVIADLGMSSYQLEQSGKGFSFLKDEPLDMRMDPTLQFTAYDLINEMNFDELNGIISKYGEENFSKRIARAIIKTRTSKTIQNSLELAAIISNSIPKKYHPKNIHPATKTFQALRIAINNELENLQLFMNKAVSFLKPGGRLIIISFHSLEDRIVKKTFQHLNKDCVCPSEIPECICDKQSVLKIVTKKPIRPDEEEIFENPRSRSSKMRVGERI